MRRILICVLLGIMTSALLLTAQDPDSDINHLSDLSRHGQLDQLVHDANSLLANDKLTPIDQGIVLTYLGHAYQKRGDFSKATSSYEKALAIFEHDGLHPTEYATTLGTLATLYADTGQTSAAKHVLLRSLHLFENESDHAAAAMMWNDLATLAAEEHSHSEARKDITRAIAESHLAPTVSPDELCSLVTTQARIAELEGDPQIAISGYQHALTLWKQSHDDHHPDTGWLYVLLGGAYLEARDIPNARETTRHGLNLLEDSSGHTPRFFAAELMYSRVLDAAGDHNEASSLRKEAQSALNTTAHQAQGQISIVALR